MRWALASSSSTHKTISDHLWRMTLSISGSCVAQQDLRCRRRSSKDFGAQSISWGLMRELFASFCAKWEITNLWSSCGIEEGQVEERELELRLRKSNGKTTLLVRLIVFAVNLWCECLFDLYIFARLLEILSSMKVCKYPLEHMSVRLILSNDF